MTKRIKLIEDGKELQSRVKALIKSATGFKTELDVVARSVLMHTLQHGNVMNVTNLQKLYQETLQVVDANMLGRWFLLHGKAFLDVKKDGKRYVFSINKDKRNAIIKDAEKMAAFAETMATCKPYYLAFTPSNPDPKAFAFGAALKTLVARSYSRQASDKAMDDDDYAGREEALALLKKIDPKAWEEINKKVDAMGGVTKVKAEAKTKAPVPVLTPPSEGATAH